MNRCNWELNEPKDSSLVGHTLHTVYLYFKYCNLKCRHCWINPPYSDERAVKEDELSFAKLFSALEECRQLGMKSIKITGGEPFTRSDIFELFDYIRENKLRLSIETNATLIGEKEARALKNAQALHVAVSLDGSTAQIHESLRGVAGSFNAALEGVRCLKKEGLTIQFIISLWRGNKEYIRAIIALAKMLRVNSVKINPICNISRANRMDEDNETLSVEETIKFYRQLREETKYETEVKVIFDIPPAFLPLVNYRFENVCTCGIFNILGILGDGGVSICGIGSTTSTLRLGRIGEDRIKDIWEKHSVLKELREVVPKKMTGICSRCILKYYCIGKCRAEAYYQSGSLRAPFSFCENAYRQGLFPASRMMS